MLLAFLLFWISCCRGALPYIHPHGSWPCGAHTVDSDQPNATPDSALPWNRNSGHGSYFKSSTEPQLHIFQDWARGHGTLQIKKCNYIQIKNLFTCVNLKKIIFWRYHRNPTPTSDRGIPPTQSSSNTSCSGGFISFNIRKLKVFFRNKL